jgi:hypothetical protein
VSALTPKQRDALSEDELIEHDMRDVARNPKVSEASVRGMIRERVRRERSTKAQDAADDALAAQIGSTRAVVRQARHEQAAQDAADRHRRELSAARSAVAATSAPSLRSAQTQQGRNAVTARVNRDKARAREMHSEGLSAAQIATRMTKDREAQRLPDDDPKRPIHPRTVQRWLED